MGCCGLFMKWLLYFFNILAVIAGVLLIVFGSLILDRLGDLTAIRNIENIDIIPIIVLVLGALILFVSLLACCGAMKYINWCVILYSFFMFILMCLQIALVVWVFLQKGQFLANMNTIVYTAFENRSNEDTMNILQTTLSCCGYNNYLDYADNDVPSSCCGFSLADAPCPSSIYTYKEGCKKIFYDFWSDNLGYVCFGGIVVAVIELLALISACVVAAFLRKSYIANAA